MIQPEGLTLSSFTSVYAQHMTREAGNNCFDAEIGWYSSPFSDCSDVVITPSCQCQYCGTYFETNLTKLQHEKSCPSRSKDLVCSYCHCGFDDDSELNQHEQNCPERYKCSKCGQNFSSQEGLDSHTCGGEPNTGGIGGSGGSGGTTSVSTETSSANGSSSFSPRNTDTPPNRLRKAAKEVFNQVINAYPSSAACNKGVSGTFEKLFGCLPSYLNQQANPMYYDLLKRNDWIKIPMDKVNAIANEGYFVIFCSPFKTDKKTGKNGTIGHTAVVLPGYSGSTDKDIYTMDTGYFIYNNIQLTRTECGMMHGRIGSSYKNNGGFFYYKTKY